MVEHVDNTHREAHHDQDVSLVFIGIDIAPHQRIPLLMRLTFEDVAWNVNVTLTDETVFGETALKESQDRSKLFRPSRGTSYLIENLNMDAIHAFEQISKSEKVRCGYFRGTRSYRR